MDTVAELQDQATRSSADKKKSTLFSYIRPYAGRVVVGAMLLLLTNALDKAIPWMLQYAVDALRAGALGQVRDWAVGVVATAAVMWIIRTLSRIHVFNVGRDVEYDLRNAVLARIHLLGDAFFHRMSAGEIMSRATNDLGQVRLLAGFGQLHVMNTVYAYGMAVTLMILISPKLTLLALAPYPLFIVVARVFSRAMFRRSREAQEALGNLADRAQENLSAVRVVRAYALEEYENERFEEANRIAIDRNMNLVMIRAIMWPILVAVGSLGTLIVVWQGGSMVLADELTIGEFAAFNAYLGQLMWPTMAFGWLLSVVQRGRAGFIRVQEILDAEPEVQDIEGARMASGPGAIETRGLSFSYGEAPVLRDVSLAVPAGGSLAVVGPTASGKSTLAALLARFLPTPKQTIYLDGDDVTELSVRSLRRSVGYAKQEPFLFSTTVTRNIAFAVGADDDVEARVREAAREAAVLEEIEGLPDGFNTVVGERGVQLSGGQKQRIALARALLNEPTVIVLDDPLSAVDARTERAILQALDRAGEGRTLILITHRVAAAARADHIVVLESGRIVERGSHDELVRAGGSYSKLAARQRAERELERL